MTPALRVSGLSVSYGQVEAVRGVSFEVGRGEFFCVVGANGSGKTSLIRAILGLAPISAGSVFFGVPRDRVGYLPQVSAIPLDMPATAREIVITGRRSGRGAPRFYSASDRAAVDAVFERMDISELADRRIGELSGGQRQRVLLARALVGEPELLLLDEPYAGLDEEAGCFLRFMLREPGGSLGISVVMVSHDFGEVRRMATSVAVLDRRLVFRGTPDGWDRFRAAI